MCRCVLNGRPYLQEVPMLLEAFATAKCLKECDKCGPGFEADLKSRSHGGTRSLLFRVVHLMPSVSSTKELLERSKRRRLERQNAPPSSIPSSPLFPQTPNLQLPMPPPFSLDPTPSPFATPASTTTLSIRGTSMTQLKNFGERELKRVKLEPATDSDFRTYLAVSHPTSNLTPLKRLADFQQR